MKTSFGQYVELLGKATNEQQYFIKKILDALQLIKPQSKEFSNQLNQLKQEFEQKTANQNLEPSEEVSKFDSSTRQVQKDIESINVQLRVLKSANASSRKGQGAPDLKAIEKSKKLKESLKNYQNESSLEISEIKTSIAKNSNELKNSGETITSIQASVQATREELNIIKAKLQAAEEKESVVSQVKNMQLEIEALKSITEVIHKGLVSKEVLTKMRQSDTHTINILKNSIQSLKDEVKGIKLLKQGKIPTNFLDLIESIDQSINTLQDEMKSAKQDINDNSSLLENAQKELANIRVDTDQLKSASSIGGDNSSLSDRINLIEERVNTLSSHSLQFDQEYNDQRDFIINLKEEVLPNLTDRVIQVETKVNEIPIPKSKSDEKSKSIEEYQNLNQKVEQMIKDIQSSNIPKRSMRTKGNKPDVPRTVGTLRTFQKALLAQEKAEQSSVYNNIEPSHLPIVVQSMDQLISEVYSEMYKIRDQFSKDIADLKKYSIPLKVDDQKI